VGMYSTVGAGRDTNNPQAGKARKKAFSYKFDNDQEFAAKVRKLRAEKGLT
jgi:hypothetical protein